MNEQMAYLIGMIYGNGEIQRDRVNTTIAIRIPHKILETDYDRMPISVYVKASIADIKNILDPLLGVPISFTQQNSVTTLSFTLPNDNYISREIMSLVGNYSSHNNMRFSNQIFQFKFDEKVQFLRGLSDVTAYIRRSNRYYGEYEHRVYIEVPKNWFLVVDICNLLKDIDVPVQNIDWAHPNMRDSNLKKYNMGNIDFWKKEHQIKVFANEFQVVGFSILHKKKALAYYVKELIKGFNNAGKNASTYTHRYYWQVDSRITKKPSHPGENDDFIPVEIRGKHYDSWKEIARDLGYGK